VRRSSRDMGPVSAGSASVWAATRVKPEQAPKELMQMSNCPDNGGDRCCPAWRTEAAGRICRGTWRSTYASSARIHVRSAEVHGVVQRRFRRRPTQKSEELIVVTKPSNVGGAKELWFGACLNETDEWGLA
jgi:hypothetical protein